MRKPAEKFAEGLAGNGAETLQRMTAMNGAAGEVMAEALKAYIHGMSAWNDELMKFMKLRMEHDMQLSESLAKCQSLEDAARLQQAWMQQTTEEYLAEASKLMELATKTATENWAPIYDRANKALSEFRTG